MNFTTITTNELQQVIEMNNGSISSFALATILGKNHSDVMKKITAQNFSDLQIVDETYTTNNNGSSVRKVALLPEKEAMAIAMSYDVQLGMKVYEAYQAYKAALEAVTNADTLEEAQEIAEKALNVRIFEAISTKFKRIGSLFNEVYVSNTPVQAHKLIYAEYRNQSDVFSKDKEYREYFLNTWLRTIDHEITKAVGEQDVILVTALKAQRGEVVGIQKRIAELRKTLAEQSNTELQGKLKYAENALEWSKFTFDVEPTEVITMHDIDAMEWTHFNFIKPEPISFFDKSSEDLYNKHLQELFI